MPERITYYIPIKIWDEIIFHSQKSTVAPFEFGNGYGLAPLFRIWWYHVIIFCLLEVSLQWKLTAYQSFAGKDSQSLFYVHCKVDMTYIFRCLIPYLIISHNWKCWPACSFLCTHNPISTQNVIVRDSLDKTALYFSYHQSSFALL